MNLFPFSLSKGTSMTITRPTPLPLSSSTSRNAVAPRRCLPFSLRLGVLLSSRRRNRACPGCSYRDPAGDRGDGRREIDPLPGTGNLGAVGMNWNPTAPWHATAITSYTRTIDYPAPPRRRK